MNISSVKQLVNRSDHHKHIIFLLDWGEQHTYRTHTHIAKKYTHRIEESQRFIIGISIRNRNVKRNEKNIVGMGKKSKTKMLFFCYMLNIRWQFNMNAGKGKN